MTTPFADLALAKRLERAESHACAQFAAARKRLFTASGSEWIECAGAYAVFDGVGSPVTQSFGLGLFEELTAEPLDRIERFFFDRGSPAFHEICPHVGVRVLELLCRRGYTPIEISNVMYRPVEKPADAPRGSVRARAIGPEEARLWTDISVRGWAQEHPEFLDFFESSNAISATRADSICFLGEVDGEPGAAGVLCLHEGVALFGGSSTVPELRRRGLQSALLEARMRYASEHGCDLAMMVAEPGSNSQRNVERQGFRVAYTRIKWQLSARR